MDSKLILVIDDEIQIRRLLRVILEGDGYRVFDADTGHDGLLQAAQRKPDVVLLDLGLPDLDGIEVLRRVREWSTVPVIVLSVRDADDEKIKALDNGANDYVTKPFSAGELLARIRVSLRSSEQPTTPAVFSADGVEIDLVSRIVKKNGVELKFTSTEYEVLRYLALNAGRVVIHHQLLTKVWGPKASNQTHYLRVYVARLRDKLEDDPNSPRLLITEPGIGYRLLVAPVR
jgi:two-component system, OmpR family, KDP operon response regulator KdpE